VIMHVSGCESNESRLGAGGGDDEGVMGCDAVAQGNVSLSDETDPDGLSMRPPDDQLLNSKNWGKSNSLLTSESSARVEPSGGAPSAPQYGRWWGRGMLPNSE
jgi:hypothetical protein